MKKFIERTFNKKTSNPVSIEKSRKKQEKNKGSTELRLKNNVPES